MSNVVNWATFIAFLLGVLFSTTVKGLVSKVRGSA